jgi:hypothetical protein
MAFNIQEAIDSAIAAAVAAALAADAATDEVTLAAVRAQAVADIQAALNADAAADAVVLASKDAQIATLQARIAELEAGEIETPPPPPPPATTTWPKGNAGVQDGVTLTNYTGPMTVTANGAVIENKIINGTLTVRGNNVTIRNCRVQNFQWYGIMQDVDFGSTNLRIENCDINGLGASRTTGVALGGGNTALIGCDITGMVIAVKVWGPVVIRGNYIHDLNEPSSNPDDRHFDGIALHGGGNSTIENNAIIMPPSNGGTAAVFITCQEGNTSNVTVNNNLLMGQPSYAMYAVEEGRGTMSGIVITNNYIDRGIYGHILIDGHTPVQTGNVLWNEGVDPTPAAVAAWKSAS